MSFNTQCAHKDLLLWRGDFKSWEGGWPQYMYMHFHQQNLWVSGFNGTWNGGIVEWATMTNDPVPHHLFARAHYAAQLEQSQKGERE